MKYKFRPQTALLVAGVLAATYAEACLYQHTSVICFYSGSTVDNITWRDGSGSSPVTAFGDWYAYSQAGHYFAVTGSGTGGYSTYTPDGLAKPVYCTGQAKFNDYSGHSTTVASWENDAADYADTFVIRAFNGPLFYTGNPSGSTCQ